MAKPKEFFDFGFPEQKTFLKDGLRKKTTSKHWALLEYSKPNGLFSQHDPEHDHLAANYEAENLHMAFQQASDMGEWEIYLEKYPPSPKALAVLIMLGLEQHHQELRVKGGKGKANKYNQIFEKVVAEKGDKPKHKVELELLKEGASQSTINRRLKGVKFSKKKKS